MAYISGIVIVNLLDTAFSVGFFFLGVKKKKKKKKEVEKKNALHNAQAGGYIANNLFSSFNHFGFTLNIFNFLASSTIHHE